MFGATGRDVHERRIPASPKTVGALLDSLASGKADRLWPHECWTPMRLDRPLAVGAAGGHAGRYGARYEVTAYEPGRRVEFTFIGPRGLSGWHAFDVIERPDGSTLLRHTLEVRCTGLMRLAWPWIHRPLHDALIEDALDKATRQVGGTMPGAPRYGWWVRTLRFGWRRLPNAGWEDRASEPGR